MRRRGCQIPGGIHECVCTSMCVYAHPCVCMHIYRLPRRMSFGRCKGYMYVCLISSSDPVLSRITASPQTTILHHDRLDCFSSA